eukprot:TRINITY_DN8906_c0_g1_i1.p1 TRINITY_DN8906_c0_g1~~TRINITY_DN8906_c0_g1_i1.p1  ORF type:complete len:227 (-),score=39.01 TRINITY_DN8906_c0_g1_i1:7-687(-)
MQDPNLRLAWQREYDGRAALARYPSCGRVILDPGNPCNDVAKSLSDWSLLLKWVADTCSMMENPDVYRVEQIEQKIDTLEQKVDTLSAALNQRLSTMDKHIGELSNCVKWLTLGYGKREFVLGQYGTQYPGYTLVEGNWQLDFINFLKHSGNTLRVLGEVNTNHWDIVHATGGPICREDGVSLVVGNATVEAGGVGLLCGTVTPTIRIDQGKPQQDDGPISAIYLL